MTINAQAIARAKALSQAGTNVGIDLCLATVRGYFRIAGYPSSFAAKRTALNAWLFAGGHDGPNTHYSLLAPAGVPYFFVAKNGKGAGHIVLTDHYDKAGDLWVWTTDFKRKGKVDLVRAKDIASGWNMTALGWSETLLGVRVHRHVTA
ncbi:MAG: hypothetical protein ACRD0H_22210 [Actinomycetes bacterium]